MRGAMRSGPLHHPDDGRGWAMAAAILVFAWTAFAWPWITGSVTIPWDAKLYYYPAIVELARGGAAPWTGAMFAGLPAIADPASFHFTPTVRLFAALWPDPSMRDVDVMQLAHLLFGGVGMLLLGRVVGLAPAAACVGALVLMLGGPAAGRLQHTMMTISIAWLPWALLALAAVVRGRGARGLLAVPLLGVCAAALAVGRDQVAFLSAWVVLLAALVPVARRFRADPAGAVRLLARLAAAGVVTVLLLAVPALLSAEFLALCDRGAIGFVEVAHASLQPLALLGLLVPDVFGALVPGAYWGPGRLPWMALSATGFDWTDDTVSHLYVGAAIPVLLAAAAVAPGRPSWRAWGALAVTAAGAVYMLGAWTPLFRLAYEALPGVALFRRPADATFLFAFGLATLAALAAQRLVVDGGAIRVRAPALVALTAIGLIAGVALVRIGLWGGRMTNVGLAALAAAGWTVATAAAVMVARRRPALVVLPLVLLAADLVWHGSGRPFNAVGSATVAPYAEGGRALAARIRDLADAGPGPGRAEIFGLGGDWQNAPRAHAIEQTLGYSPLRLVAYDRAVGARQNSHEARRTLTPDFGGHGAPLARLLGIRVVATGAPIETILPPAATAGLEPLGREGPAWLYRPPAPLPRLLAVGGAVVDDATIPADPERTVALAYAPTPVDALPAAAPPPGTVAIRGWGPGRIEAEVVFDRPGVVVVNEIRYPGWIATVNGAPADLVPANRLFMALALPAGRHAIMVRFAPLSADALRRRLGR